MIGATSLVLPGVTTVLGSFMMGRGLWALQQPWGSLGEKLFALAFFASLTAFGATG